MNELVPTTASGQGEFSELNVENKCLFINGNEALKRLRKSYMILSFILISPAGQLGSIIMF